MRILAGRCMLVVVLAVSFVVAADPGDPAPPPYVPPELQVPAGQHLYLALDAVGVQIYECRAGAWAFVAPRATLYDETGDVAGTHYAGPTWEGMNGGKVLAARVAGVPAPDSSAIPWLLLRAVSTSGAPPFSKAASIQRLETMGGVAPAAPCTDGAREEVEYTARYYFYK